MVLPNCLLIINGLSLYLQRGQPLDNVGVAVVFGVVGDGHRLMLNIYLHVLDALAERRHVVHNLFPTLTTSDVGLEYRCLFLGVCRTQAQQHSQAKNNKLFHLFYHLLVGFCLLLVRSNHLPYGIHI